MNAIEAITYCLNSTLSLEDDEFHSKSVLDRNSRPHWVCWSEPDASPKLCSESFKPFTESLSPYREFVVD